MNRQLPALLLALLLLAPGAATAAQDRYLATFEDGPLAFLSEEIVGGPATLAVDKAPGSGSLEVTLGGSRVVYTPDPGFLGADRFRLRRTDVEREAGGSLFEVWVSVAPARIPVAGDWNGDGVTEVGRYDSGETKLYLYQENVPSPPQLDYAYPGAGPGWRPFAGDFDGDGLDEIGLYDPATGHFHLLRLPAEPVPPPGLNQLELLVELPGVPLGAGEIPMAGDWTGDGGVDGLGLFVPGETASFYLWEGFEAPTFEVSFALLAPGTHPVAGDWDGDRQETVGLYDPARGDLHFLDDHSGGPADGVLRVEGVAGLDRLPVAGDWFGDGVAIGLLDPDTLGIALYAAGHPGVDPIVVIIPSNPPCDPACWEDPPSSPLTPR